MTVTQLRQLMEQHQLLTRQLADQRNTSNQLAVTTAVEAMNERLLKLNELRGQLQDMIATLETKLHAEAKADAFEIRLNIEHKELEELKRWRSATEGRNQMILILWPLVVGIIVFILNKYFR